MEAHEAEVFSVCEWCRERVDATDPNVVRAFEQVEAPAMGIGMQRLDGLAVLFHRDCFPRGQSYRLDE